MIGTKVARLKSTFRSGMPGNAADRITLQYITVHEIHYITLLIAVLLVPG